MGFFGVGLGLRGIEESEVDGGNEFQWIAARKKLE
jgi:hypothetical protein